MRSTSGTLSTSMVFTGEQFDAKARLSQGLYYLRARYYDPSIGRFLSRDPLRGWFASPQSQNPYAYALNNPANLNDPTGLQVERTAALPAAGGLCVVVSGGTCAVMIGATAVAALSYSCLRTPGCPQGIAEAGGAAVETLGDVKDWVGGLFSKGHSKPAEPNFTPWYPSSSQPGQIFPPGFQPPTKGLGKWMYRAIVAGMAAYIAEQSGILNMCVPPKE